MSNESIVVSINATSGDLKIDGDPNWDDQELRIDGKISNEAYSSPKGQAVGAGVDGWTDKSAGELMMGIEYSGSKNNNQESNTIQMSVGLNKDGLMSVTDQNDYGTPTIKYSVIAQTKWILVLKFEDV